MPKEGQPSDARPSLGSAVDALAEGDKVFDRYTLMRVVGRGRLTVVWLAWDEILGRDAALKFLPEMARPEASVLATLKREVHKLQEVKHPGIVPLDNVLQEGSLVALSTDFIEGHTLAELRAQKHDRVFAPAELSDWLKQLGAALDHAHTEGLLAHGQLTPSNLIVDKRGGLHVTDYGLTPHLERFVERVSDFKVERDLAYLSPQQAAGDPITPLDDIYSLGATLYELLTSKPPFFTGDILLQLQQKVPPPMTHRRKELRVIGEPISRAWEEAVTACLAKEPAERIQSIAELIEHLQLQGAADGAAEPENARPAAAPASSRPLILAAVVMFTVLGMAGWLAGRMTAPPKVAQASSAAPEPAPVALDEQAEKMLQEAEAARQTAEAEARRLIAEAEQLKAAEKKRLAEAEATRRDAESKRMAAEAEAKRIAAEAEQARKERDTLRTAATEKAMQEAEARAKAAEAEAKRLLAEAEQMKQEEEKRLVEAEKARKEAEAKLMAAEADAKRIAESAKRIAADADSKRRAAEAATEMQRRRDAEERARQMALVSEKDRQEAEARRLEEAKRAEEARRLQEAKARAEAEAAKASRQFDPAKPWVNSLGMKFVPLGDVHIGASEARVADFEFFVRTTRHDAGKGWSNPGFNQGASHPVVNVSWQDAQAFCQWLTQKERAEGLIGPELVYRLPSDLEWSRAAGLPSEPGATPSERDGKVRGVFTWGNEWPPPSGAGNFSDTVSYDHFETTAPVGSFRPNRLGIYDLGGNVWEWCEDWMDNSQKSRVLRGGSWFGYLPGSLAASYRRYLAPTERKNDHGFRCVLAKEKP